MLVDTHCHLDFESFDSDREAILEASRAEGVSYVLNPAISIESSHKVTNLSGTYPEVFAAVGIHPNDAEGWNGETIPALRGLCQHPKVIAIGEIGLDYYRKSTPPQIQRQAFQEQLELAAEFNLPAIIHCREAHEDLFNMLSAWHEQLQKTHHALAEAPGVLHSFSGSYDDALHALSLHFFLGVNGMLTFEKSKNLRAMIQHIPLQHILIETDAPFLTPHPFRGKRNQPAYIIYIAERLAVLHNTSVENIQRQTAANADELFHWGDKHLA